MKEDSENLSKRVDFIEAKIRLLEEQKDIICDSAMSDDKLPIPVKFRMWSICSRNKTHMTMVFNSKLNEFPGIVKLLSKGEYTGNTINILEHWKSEFDSVMYQNDSFSAEEKDIIEKAMVEIMTLNIGTLRSVKI